MFWRARLTSTTLPKDEAHVFLPAPNSTDNVTGVIYPIGGENQNVWTTSASAARMQEIGVPIKAADRSYKDNVIGSAQPLDQTSCTDHSTAATYLDDKQREIAPQQRGMREVSNHQAAVLCCAVLCCAVLCCSVVCCAGLVCCAHLHSGTVLDC